MIRNIALFLAGAVIGAAALVAAAKFFRSVERKLASLNMTSAPGTGSPVRVVGGSLHLELNSNVASSFGTNQFKITSVDASEFALAGVSAKSGKPLVVYPSSILPPNHKWIVKEYVLDASGSNSRGIEIDGTPGDTAASGTIIINVIGQGDRFAIFDGSYYYYYSGGNSSRPGSNDCFGTGSNAHPQSPCEKCGRN